MSDEVPPRFGEQEPDDAAPGSEPQPSALGGPYYPTPGYQPPAYQSNGYQAQDYPAQGYSAQGYPAQGFPPPGYPAQGYQPSWGTPPPPSSGLGKRRFAILGGTAAALLVAGIVIAAVALNGIGKSSSAASAGSASPAAAGPGATAPASAATAGSAVPDASCRPATSLSAEPVGYQACGTAAKNAGIPVYDSAQAHKTYTVTIRTNRGNIVFTADGSKAPYTVYSFVYLVRKQYFAETPCHRLTTAGIYVLQCGDPSGTGSGGPGYEFQDENLSAFGPAGSDGSVVYPAGTVAMANAGYGTNGSQFFLVYQDSPLEPLYTPFGTITQGLDVLRSIAAQGSNDSNGTGDGRPNESVLIEQVTAA